MDEYETPIESIRQPDQQSPPMNYNDMLQNIETNGGHTHEPVQANFPPNPIVQSRNPIHQNSNMNMNFIPQQSQPNTEDSEPNTSLSNMQRDFLFIVIPAVMHASICSSTISLPKTSSEPTPQ